MPPPPVGLLAGTTIMCQCLGSEFDVTISAPWSNGPADRPLNVYDVQVIPDNDDDPKAIAQTRQYLTS